MELSGLALRILLSAITVVTRVSGGAAEQVRSGDGLALTIAADGPVQTVSIDGKAWPTADVPSGLLLRDVAADGEFVPAGGAVAQIGRAHV